MICAEVIVVVAWFDTLNSIQFKVGGVKNGTLESGNNNEKQGNAFANH